MHIYEPKTKILNSEHQISKQENDNYNIFEKYYDDHKSSQIRRTVT